MTIVKKTLKGFDMKKEEAHIRLMCKSQKGYMGENVI